jgi:hypothetical protein
MHIQHQAKAAFATFWRLAAFFDPSRFFSRLISI